MGIQSFGSSGANRIPLVYIQYQETRPMHRASRPDQGENMHKTGQGKGAAAIAAADTAPPKSAAPGSAPSWAAQQLHEREIARRVQASHVTKTLWPGQAGTLKLMHLHGTPLVCVRYRRDANGLRRYTTVEIVVDTAIVKSDKAKRQMFDVAIAFEEQSLRTLAKKHGAKWSPERKMWTLSGQAVQALNLVHRARPRSAK